MPTVPIVVLTGLSNAAVGTKAIQHGAQDYLQKGLVAGTELLRAIRYARERAQIVSRTAEDGSQRQRPDLIAVAAQARGITIENVVPASAVD